MVFYQIRKKLQPMTARLCREKKQQTRFNKIYIILKAQQKFLHYITTEYPKKTPSVVLYIIGR